MEATIGSDSGDAGDPRRWAILAVLCAVSFMAQLDFFIVNVALASMGHAFSGASLSGLSWVLNAYAIVLAAVLVPAGRLADLRGRKKVLLLGIAVFTLASAICGAAPTLDVLIAGRALQAFGAAMIVPTSLGLLYPSFPARQHTLVVGIWAGVAAVAASSGPPVGGLLVALSWRWIFVINLPIGLATLVAGVILLPEVRQPRGARLPDAFSVVGLAAAVSLLVLATVQGPEWGWGDVRVIVLFALAAVAAAFTLWRIHRSDAPVVEPVLFRSRSFAAATAALFLFFIGFGIFVLGSALFMQDVWHFSAFDAGAGICPAPITACFFALLAGPIQRRFGRTLPAVIGTMGIALAAFYWLFTIGPHADYAGEMLPGLIIMGIGSGLSQAPLFAAAATLRSDRATTGSAVLNVARQIGSAIGVAVLIALTAKAADPVAGFDRAWAVQAGVGVGASLVLAARPLLLRLVRPPVAQPIDC
jgi:EmrB/QacA subfamily drug resistance transporter